MEHEVFVQVPAESVREILADPARVARCVPGLQQAADADGGGPAGRLKVRVDGRTITYRGSLRITPHDSAPRDGAPHDSASLDGGFAVEGEGTEVRGSGSVKLSLTLRLTATATGTTLVFSGTARGDGRLTDLSPEAALASAHRLLDRFGGRVESEAESGSGTGSGAAAPHDEADAEADAEAPAAPDAEESGAGNEAAGDTSTPSVSDEEASAPSLDPVSEAEFITAAEPPSQEPPVEAAHARRTMIGRSEEEVDHAPPRGRYAPVPAPSATTTGATLRWAAPAAALAVASVVVVSRALRRRR